MLFAVIAALPADIAVLFIEHDMDIVFSFATRIIVLVAGARAARGRPRHRPQRSARARGLSRPGRPCLSPLLELRDVRAGYGEAVVLDGVSLALPGNGSLAVLGRNGVGKTTLLLTVMGFVPLARGSIRISRPRHLAAAAAPPAPAWASAGCRRSATSSPRSPSRRT